MTILPLWNALQAWQVDCYIIFTLTFTNQYSPSHVADCTCMTYLGCTFVILRLYCIKIWPRSLFYFKHDIVLCINSLFCTWTCDFSNYLAIKLTTEMITFHKDTSTDLLKTARIISDSTSIQPLLKSVHLHFIITATDGFPWKPTSYQIFSLPSDLEVFKHFSIVLS